MVPSGLFGWASPHVQPLTPVSEVSEPPESPSPYGDGPSGDAGVGVREGEGADDEDVEEDEVEPPPAAVSFWRLFEFADGLDWALMAAGALAAAAHGAALVVYLHYFGRSLNLLDSERIQSALHGRSDELLNQFKQHALYIIYIAAGVFVAGWIEVSCWILTGERQTAVIRSKYVQVLLNQDMSFFDTYGNNGDIVSQVLSDVLLIQSAISEKVGNYIHNMATFVGGLIVGLLNCWQIALLTLATGPLIVAAGGISNIFLHRLAENIQDAYAEAASIAEQATSYIRTLYAFTNETLAKYSYATSLQATLRYGILISLVQGIGLGFTYGLAICSCALQLWVGRHLITHGKADGGQVVVALFAVILSGLGLNQAATNFYSFEQGRIAAYRLYEMISRSTSSTNLEGTTIPQVQGNIEFRNVYFSYLSRPEIPILSGFFLSVPARKTVALVGRNGSGKSSIIPLMERFYDPTLGEVLLDGENIKNLKVEWLRSQIGLVTQEPALLSLSIRENIAYGRFATFDQIEEAAKTAHAHGFISSLEKGYETQVGRAGMALTDEQKIKISIARAVLSSPSILLLDEVTGGLDFEAEKAVQGALDVLMLGRSTIIIARRLSLIKHADYIAVMEEGHLVEMGTHDELLNLDGLYAELLRCEEATKLPKRMPTKNSRERKSLQFEDPPISQNFQESSSPKMAKSPSLQRTHGMLQFWRSDTTRNSHDSPKDRSPPPEQTTDNGIPLVATERAPSIKRHDSFEMELPNLPKVDIHPIQRQSSKNAGPDSPISPLLTSDPKNERSHSQTFSRPQSERDDTSSEQSEPDELQHHKPPSFWRLAALSIAEWPYALLGTIGAAIFGSFNPLLAYTIALTVSAYYQIEVSDMQREVNRWCLFIVGMGVITVLVNWLQHFYFGIMGEKMTERIRRMMFSAMLRNEAGWFDKEENSADTLSMRLANDATFVRAAFSNRLSIFIQDTAAVSVALLIGMLLGWRVALVALATLPVLVISAIAQKLWLAGFSKGIQEMHRKASLVLEDAVRNIYTVVAFCAGDKIMELYKLHLGKILKQSLVHGLAIGFGFGFSQFLLFACNALLLWYIATSVDQQRLTIATGLKQYILFSFASFALVEPFGLAPYILKRRKSLTSVFEIIDREPKIDPDDNTGLKPPNVYGSIEFKNVDFSYPVRPEIFVLSNFNLKVRQPKLTAPSSASDSTSGHGEQSRTMAPTVEIRNLTFTYPGIDGKPPPGAPPLIEDVCFSLEAGQRCLLVGSNGAGKTTILKILGGKHMVDPSMVRVLGRSAFHDTALTSSGDLCYLGGEWRRDVAFAGYQVNIQMDISAEKMLFGVTGVDPQRRDELIKILDIDLTWRMHKASDGQRRRVQICMGLLKPFKVLLLDEITVDLDVLARANLLTYLKKECAEQGATIIYATHIFDGLDDWPTHIVYVAHGKLQLALPLEKVKEMSQLSLMRTVERWLRKERDEDRRKRKERKEKGLPAFDKVIEGSRVVNNGWAAGRLTSTIAGEENFSLSSNSVLR